MGTIRRGPFISVCGVAAVSLMGGCGKGKSPAEAKKEAAEDALGIAELSNDEAATIKQEAGWDDARMGKFKIIKGFKLSSKFKGDLGKTVEIPIPLDLPGTAANGKTPSYSLLKKRTFEVGPNKFTRFEIITVARYEADQKKLVIDGEKIGAFLDDKDRVKKDNSNQEGDYLLVKGQGDAGLAYLTGKISLKKNDNTEEALGGAVVFTTDSPFVTTSGSTDGKFLLAVVDQGDVQCQQSGMITATHVNVGSKAAGTPTSTQGEIPCIGVLDNYKAQVVGKSSEMGADETKTKQIFDTVNNKVTEFLGAWKTGEVNLTFVQPPAPKAPAVPPEAPKSPAPPADSPIAQPTTPPAPPSDPAKIDPPPPSPSAPFVRPDPASGYGVNLGCTYTEMDKNTGVAVGLVGDVGKYDDYPGTKGWRFFGDVRITNQNSVEIFGAATAAKAGNDRNPDVADGYCLLTTGNQLFKKFKSPIFDPKDGKTSEIWQKVSVPENATGVQIRVAFFSMEYPTYIGTQFNDNFYVKFDESPYFIAQGNLNDLAGANDPALKDSLGNCKTQTSFAAPATSWPCGEWDATTFNDKDKNLTGALWDVQDSDQGPSLGAKYKCGTDAGGVGKCYPGMIQPRVICAPLDKDTERGKTLTLRIGVADAGDSYFDSALAVDSVVFSTEANPCATMFTPEPESQSTRWDPTM
jgi:hypothetical protein